MQKLKIDLKDEKWQSIEEYGGYYEVSSFGNVRSVDRYVRGGTGMRLIRGKHLKTKFDSKKKYNLVILTKFNNPKTHLVHRLVAAAFIENSSNLPEVNHKDGNPSNNTVGNLEWVTRSENILHSFKELNRPVFIIPRNKCHLAKLTVEQQHEVERLWEEKVPHREIANRYNMSVSGIEKIITKYRKSLLYEQD